MQWAGVGGTGHSCSIEPGWPRSPAKRRPASAHPASGRSHQHGPLNASERANPATLPTGPPPSTAAPTRPVARPSVRSLSGAAPLAPPSRTPIRCPLSSSLPPPRNPMLVLQHTRRPPPRSIRPNLTTTLTLTLNHRPHRRREITICGRIPRVKRGGRWRSWSWGCGGR